MAEPVRAIDPRIRTNAQLIANAWRLGYINPPVLDCTFGLGKWWTDMADVIERHNRGRRIPYLTATDIDSERSPDWASGLDYRDLHPFKDGQFATVCYDPAYKMNGSGGSHEADERYGADTKLTIPQRIEILYGGLDECKRVTKVGGHLLVKCQDQVVSGRVFWQTHTVTLRVVGSPESPSDHYDDWWGGFGQPDQPRWSDPEWRADQWRLVDSMLLIGEMVQPKKNRDGTKREQRHVRRNYSTLLIFRRER